MEQHRPVKIAPKSRFGLSPRISPTPKFSDRPASCNTFVAKFGCFSVVFCRFWPCSVRRAISSYPFLSAETNPRLVIGIVGEDGTADAMDVQGEAEEETEDGGPLKRRKL